MIGRKQGGVSAAIIETMFQKPINTESSDEDDEDGDEQKQNEMMNHGMDDTY